ncbi:MAG: hypothetical protein WA842_05060 [Croceibacterium sp.]
MFTTLAPRPQTAALPLDRPAPLPRGLFAGGKSIANLARARPSETQAAQANGTPPPLALNTQAPMGVSDQRAALLNPSQDQPAPLGATSRQPFDYQQALDLLAGDQSGPKRWQRIVGAIADTLTGRPLLSQAFAERDRARAQRMQQAQAQIMDWQHGDYAAQRDADLRASAPFTVGRDRVQFDPATGSSSVIYDGPEDFQLYAQDLGLEPGSEDYFRAVEDYVLRSGGPSAHGRDLELDDHRTANDSELETLRYGNRVGLEGLRQRNRVSLRQTPPARTPGASRGGAVRPTATDGSGNKVQWNGSAWVPVR